MGVLWGHGRSWVGLCVPTWGAPNSQKRCTENEEQEWALLLEGLVLMQRTSLWTCTQSCSCTGRCCRATRPALRGSSYGAPSTSPVPARSAAALLPRVSKRNVCHLYHALQLRIGLFLSFTFFQVEMGLCPGSSFLISRDSPSSHISELTEQSLLPFSSCCCYSPG